MNDSPIFSTQPLEQVREGMVVLDAAGAQIGTVRRVRMGDPQAVTLEGNEERAPVIGGFVKTDDAETPDLPDELRRELQRTGFVEVDGPILSGVDRYVPGDRVAEVVDKTVRLRPAPTTATPTMPTAPAERTEQPRIVSSVAAPSPVWTEHPPVTESSGSNRALGWGAAAVSVTGSAAGTALLYRRWRRERDRPANRARRVMKEWAETLSDRDVPAGRLGAGLALGALLLAVGRHVKTSAGESADGAPAALPDLTEQRRAFAPSKVAALAATRAREIARARAASVPPSLGRLRLAGLLALGVAGVFAWRRLRSGRAEDTGRPQGEPFSAGAVEPAAAYPPPTATQPDTEDVRRSTPNSTAMPVGPRPDTVRDEIVVERRPVDRLPADRPVGSDAGEGVRIPGRAEDVVVEPKPERPWEAAGE